MKQLLIVIFLMSLNIPIVLSQDDDKTYQMYESIYILAKQGAADNFENGVKEHNEMYHAEEPYTAWLDAIVTGPKTGWYVWMMGPCMFSHLDDRPAGEHDDHWAEKVTPHVQKVSNIEYWRMSADLSYRAEGDSSMMAEVWYVDVARGEYYRFKSLMEKVQAAFEKQAKGSMMVFNSSFNGGNGRDVAIVWPFQNWAALDDDDSIKEPFEELYGEGSWQNLLDEWEEVAEEVVSEVRSEVK